MTCPICGGPLEVVRHPDGCVTQEVWPGFIVPGLTRPRLLMKLVPFLSCSACEFCQEGTEVFDPSHGGR